MVNWNARNLQLNVWWVMIRWDLVRNECVMTSDLYIACYELLVVTKKM
jgi:hypothetical protein